jgi:hypothetical protein
LSSPFYYDAIEALPHDFWVNAERKDISPFGTRQERASPHKSIPIVIERTLPMNALSLKLRVSTRLTPTRIELSGQHPPFLLIVHKAVQLTMPSVVSTSTAKAPTAASAKKLVYTFVVMALSLTAVLGL